jgi:S1-C subfamily serine protease
LIVTALHVIADASEIEVITADGQALSAKIEARNSPLDIALMSVDEATPNYLPFAPPRSAAMGDEVFTMGFPVIDVLGEKPKFTAGTISALSGIRDEPAYLQISVPVHPGNSGGPLVNGKGQVVGMVVSSASPLPFVKATGTLPQNISWAVKSEYISPLFDATLPAFSYVEDRRRSIDHTQRALCQVRAKR